MTDDIPGSIRDWKRAYVEGNVSLSDLEDALEHYFETGGVPHDDRVHGPIRPIAE